MKQYMNAIKSIAVRAVLACGIAFFGAYAYAGVSQLSKPLVLQQIPSATFAGKGLLRFLGFQVYNASLWVAPGFKYSELGQHSIALELEYLRKFKREEIARVSLEQMRLSGSFSPEQGQQWQTALATVLPDVKPGDRLLGIYKPGASVAFALNGQSIGEIEDAQFAKMFFDIWLSPKSSAPKLRDQLLAGAPR
jgi:hypothetical protein